MMKNSEHIFYYFIAEVIFKVNTSKNKISLALYLYHSIKNYHKAV